MPPTVDPSLTRPAFLILLTLVGRPRHGLGIVEEVERHTSGEVKLGPGTLYGTLKRLSSDGLVAETDEIPDPDDDDPRRRYYRITSEGEAALRDEAEQLARLVRVAVGKSVLEAGA